MALSRWLRSVVILALVLVQAPWAWPKSGPGGPSTLFVASFPTVKLGKTERIGSFKCTIRPGRILSLREFPDEWQITVRNGDSETAGIEGQVLVGAGAFSADDNYFERFMTLELPNPSPTEPALRIEAEIQITTDQTFAHYRQVRFKTEQIKLEQIR